MLTDQSRYATIRSALEAAGFTDLPQVADIAWDAPQACILDVNVAFKKTVTTVSIVNVSPKGAISPA